VAAVLAGSAAVAGLAAVEPEDPGER